MNNNSNFLQYKFYRQLFSSAALYLCIQLTGDGKYLGRKKNCISIDHNMDFCFCHIIYQKKKKSHTNKNSWMIPRKKNKVSQRPSLVRKDGTTGLNTGCRSSGSRSALRSSFRRASGCDSNWLDVLTLAKLAAGAHGCTAGHWGRQDLTHSR